MAGKCKTQKCRDRQARKAARGGGRSYGGRPSYLQKRRVDDHGRLVIPGACDPGQVFHMSDAEVCACAQANPNDFWWERECYHIKKGWGRPSDSSET